MIKSEDIVRKIISDKETAKNLIVVCREMVKTVCKHNAKKLFREKSDLRSYELIKEIELFKKALVAGQFISQEEINEMSYIEIYDKIIKRVGLSRIREPLS